MAQTIVLCRQELKSQLNQERDSVRRLSPQKEIEAKYLQTRLEKSVRTPPGTYPLVIDRTIDRGTWQDTRVARRCSRKHLEERAQELIHQLQGNEEKLSVYERMSLRPGKTGHH
jgi:nucleoprotein TPR